jgi:urea ABC transporter ATP-binding protein UrtD
MITRFLWQGMGPGLRLFTLLVLAVGILLPLANQLLPPTSPFHVPAWVLQLIGKYLCYALLALAVDLVWGFCGILSLGHGAFFALGGYCMGMYLMRQIGSRGVYGNPLLPDFMVFLNYKQLPWFWHGFDQFWFAAIMILLVPSVLAFALGWFAFRSRVTGVYLSIITQAMTFALMLAFFRNDMGLGGNNGMTDFKEILGFPVQADGTRAALCFASAGGAGAGAGDFRSHRRLALRQGVDRGARRREPHALPRLQGRRLQALRLRPVGGYVGCRRCALRAAGRHHQSQRVCARQFDRGRALGGGRRPRHLDRSGDRRLPGQLRQDLAHRRAARILAVRAGCVVHRRHPWLPKGIMGLWGQIRDRSQARKAQGSQVGGRKGRSEQGGGAGMRSTSALLYLSGVTVSFDGFKALNNLSLLVEPGEMRAIIGPNGAGKTTMMDVITGKTRPDEGEVVFDGKSDLTKLDEADIATLGIGRKFQKPTVFETHTVRDNLLLALSGIRSWYKLLLAAPTKAEKDRLDEILTIIRMADQQHMLAARLSHGQKQWLEIGMLLAQDPKLLLVDEPVAGMTDVETETTAQVLREINRSHSVVVVEHDMSFVRALGVKVTVLHEGSMLAEGTLDQVSADPRVVEVYLGR